MVHFRVHSSQEITKASLPLNEIWTHNARSVGACRLYRIDGYACGGVT
jgi:hypothetical protein